MTDPYAHTHRLIRTPDQRLRVFVSSTLQELAEERRAAKTAIERLRLAPVMFELGARPHPPRTLYRAYLEQSHIFVGIYWQRYGWVAPGESLSGLEDEYRLSGDRPKLIYVKRPALEREERLTALLARIQEDDGLSYKPFSSAAELGELIADDLALLLTERFEGTGNDAPLAELSRPATSNLPVPFSSLVGREKELEALHHLVLRPEVRLVTLCGPGGVGKSRLALGLAATLQDAFKDGTVFVDLAPLGDPTLLPSAIAQALGLEERENLSYEDSLKVSLRDKTLLLLLDNFERLVAAASVVAELLAACPGLTVVVTSRVVLRLSAEYEVPVAPLAAPDLRRLPELEALARIDAVALFVERARAVRPDFALTPANARAVAEICARLDGLPLALELAAANVRLLSPQAMLARLVDQGGKTSFRLLAGGARDLPARQRTLRGTIEWSYALLNETEQRLFRQLAVFVGGFTLEAAEAVLAEAELLDKLVSLFDQSLVREAMLDGMGSRYGMLGVLRDYALERLEASGESEILRRAHAAYFLEVAEEARRQEGSGNWQERVTAELDNVRSAWGWYKAHRSAPEGAEAGLRLAGALAWFWVRSGYLSEGRAWLEEALSWPGLAESRSRAEALHGAGLLAWHQGNFAAALAHLEQSVNLWRALGDTRGLTASLNWLADLLVEQGSYARAQGLFEESVLLCEQGTDTPGLAWAVRGLGTTAFYRGDVDMAVSLYERSRALAQEANDARTLLRTLQRMGDLAAQQGDALTARAHYEEALLLAREGESRLSLLRLMHALAWALYRAGDNPRAAALFEESLALARAQGDIGQVAWSLNHLGDVARCEGNDARATTFYEESLALFEDLAHLQGVAAVSHNLGFLALHRGDRAAAATLFFKSLDLFQKIDHRWSVADSLAGLASVCLAGGQAEEAARLFGTASAVQEAIDMSGLQRDPANWAEVARGMNDARTLLGEAAWKAAWSTGRAMTLEQATAYVETIEGPTQA